MNSITDFEHRVAGSTVLVTGASGFIGSHLCRRLVDCHASVHAVSRVDRQSAGDNFRWWQTDLNDSSAVIQLFKAVRPQIVFHLASFVVGARELEAVLPTFHANLESAVNLLTAATSAGCSRIILANSSEEPQGFDAAAFPCSPYAAAKWASRIYGRMFYQLFQTPVVMPRIFMTYGPDQKDLQKLVPFVIRQLLRGEIPKLTSGRRLADWIYVGDVVEALVRAAVSPGIEGSEFDLGSGSLVSVRQLVEQILEIVDNGAQPSFGAISDRPFEQERPADVHFLSDRLGFQPKTSLKQGLEATVAWYRKQLEVSADGTAGKIGAF
jgi:UDP-glucose 4-epimerase